jgi:ADP-ribosylation factor GTPase-activating protein 1
MTESALQMTSKLQAEIFGMDGNKVCCDCPARNPQWATVTYGTLMCLECSGLHRNLGVHLSFVRSIAMDSWKPRQIDAMRKGGNGKWLQSMKDCCMPEDLLKFASVPESNVTNAAKLAKKYNSNCAEIYRNRMAAKLDDKEPPRFRDYIEPGVGDANACAPLEGESEQAFVTRQAKLRMAAKNRMAAKFGGGMQGMGSSPMPSNDDWFSSSLSAVSKLKDQALEVAKKVDTGAAVKGAKGFWDAADKAVAGVVDKAAPEPAGGMFFPRTNDNIEDKVGDGTKAKSKPSRAKKTAGGEDDWGDWGDDDDKPKAKPKPKGRSPRGNSSPRTTSSPRPSGGSTDASRGDPNGMEALIGETDGEYAERQARLKEEAKARMAAKFGKSGGMGSGSLGGVGGGGSGGGDSGGGGGASAVSMFSSWGMGLVNNVVALVGDEGGSSARPGGAAPSPPPVANPDGDAGGTSTDPQGIEPLMGETNGQYVARQQKLKEEAKARMAAKFGKSGGMGSGSLGGVGSDGSSPSASSPRKSPSSSPVSRKKSPAKAKDDDWGDDWGDDDAPAKPKLAVPGVPPPPKSPVLTAAKSPSYKGSPKAKKLEVEDDDWGEDW